MNTPAPATQWNTTFYDPANSGPPAPRPEDSIEQKVYTTMRNGLVTRKAIADKLLISQDLVGRIHRKLTALGYIKLGGIVGRQRYEVINPQKWKVKQ